MLKTIRTQEFGEIETIGLPSFEKPVIVEKSVVTKLAQLLNPSSFRDIREIFITNIESSENMEEYCKMLQSELSFHKTVNCLLDARVEEDHTSLMA